MRELKNEMIDLLMEVPRMDKPNLMGIINILKTPEQAQKMIDWLEDQQLTEMLQTPIIKQAHAIERTI